MNRISLAALAIVVVTGASAAAQERPASGLVEGVGGYTAFGDEGVIPHLMFGGGARVQLLPRVYAGPELIYMLGPGFDRDLFLTGSVTFDLIGGAAPAKPYAVLNGGWMLHSDGFDTRGARTLSIGTGVRIEVRDRLFVAPEVRLGSPPHLRLAVTIGSHF
jgi:hypothetical protein